MRLIGGDEIDKLSQLRLKGDIVEEFEKIAVVRILPEVLLEQIVNGSLEHERVVDGNVSDGLDLVPARLTAASNGLIHHVVGHEKVCLKLQMNGEQLLPEVQPFIAAGLFACVRDFAMSETHQLDAPSQDGSLEVFWLSQLPRALSRLVCAEEDVYGVDDAQASVELATWGVVI